MRVLTTMACLALLGACGGTTPPPANPEPSASVGPAAPPSMPPESPSAAPESPAPAATEASCDDRADPMSPIMMTPEQWDARRGAGVVKLSELNTTKDDPAQACMAAHSYRWLSTLTCDDGTRPLADSRAAQQARVGNVGPGGRCGNIVDLYKVTCPEGDIEVFVDMYWCTDAALSSPPQGA